MSISMYAMYNPKVISHLKKVVKEDLAKDNRYEPESCRLYVTINPAVSKDCLFYCLGAHMAVIWRANLAAVAEDGTFSDPSEYIFAKKPGADTLKGCSGTWSIQYDDPVLSAVESAKSKFVTLCWSDGQCTLRPTDAMLHPSAQLEAKLVNGFPKDGVAENLLKGTLLFPGKPDDYELSKDIGILPYEAIALALPPKQLLGKGGRKACLWVGRRKGTRPDNILFVTHPSAPNMLVLMMPMSTPDVQLDEWARDLDAFTTVRLGG